MFWSFFFPDSLLPDLFLHCHFLLLVIFVVLVALNLLVSHSICHPCRLLFFSVPLVTLVFWSFLPPDSVASVFSFPAISSQEYLTFLVVITVQGPVASVERVLLFYSFDGVEVWYQESRSWSITKVKAFSSSGQGRFA